MAIPDKDMPKGGRAQYDPEEIFSAISTPFISCIIGNSVSKDATTGQEVGGFSIGNDNLYLLNSNGNEQRLDPRYITGIQVTRNCPSTEKNWHFFDAFKAFLTSMGKDESLSPEELRRAGKNAQKASADHKKAVEKEKKEAPKKLEQFINRMADNLLVGPSIGAGITATINLTITGDMSLLTWLYNYCQKQNLYPQLRLQYGLTGGKGKPQRVSPGMLGIIQSVTVSDFYNLTLEVTFLQSDMIGWAPEQFNKIFGTDKRKNKPSTKSNNPKQKKQNVSDKDKQAYKEGDIGYDATGVKTRCYSETVKAIAKGLNWNIGYIEPTTILPEDVEITVDHVEEGPLIYIQKNFCGKPDPKDGDGKTVKAEAISRSAHLRDYMAFVDYDSEGTLKFYYLPRQVVTKHLLSNMRIYEYMIRGTNSGEFQSEVLDFSFSPFDLRGVQYNVKKLDGKGDTNLPVVSNSRKEVKNIKTTQESNIQGANVADTKKAVKGTAQNPNYRSIMTSNTKEALDSYRANMDYNVTNTWQIGQGTATMRILYDESLRLQQIIYVCVLCPMNDSVSIGGGMNLKKVLHPSSGLYSINSITDEISGSSATTTLGLTKLVYSQEELNQVDDWLKGNREEALEEQKKREKASKRPEDKTAKNE